MGIALRPFLEALDEKLESLDASALRSALLRHAETLSLRGRQPFLDLFNLKTEVAGDAKSLISAADSFATDCAAGHWAADYFDYSSNEWEFESEKADELFRDLGFLIDGAGEHFRVGDFATAAREYTTMFHALIVSDLDETQLPQIDTLFYGEQAVETKARWLRSLYETTESSRRARVIADAVESSEYRSANASLQDAIDASRGELSGFEEFLACWVAELRQRLRTKGEPTQHMHDLLLEASFLSKGLEGLAEIARTESVRKAKAYLAWVQAALEANERDCN